MRMKKKIARDVREFNNQIWCKCVAISARTAIRKAAEPKCEVMKGNEMKWSRVAASGPMWKNSLGWCRSRTLTLFFCTVHFYCKHVLVQFITAMTLHRKRFNTSVCRLIIYILFIWLNLIWIYTNAVCGAKSGQGARPGSGPWRWAFDYIISGSKTLSWLLLSTEDPGDRQPIDDLGPLSVQWQKKCFII